MSTLNWGDLIKDAGEVGGSYEALPDGDYDLTVIEATAKVTASGKTMFSVKTRSKVAHTTSVLYGTT